MTSGRWLITEGDDGSLVLKRRVPPLTPVLFVASLVVLFSAPLLALAGAGPELILVVLVLGPMGLFCRAVIVAMTGGVRGVVDVVEGSLAVLPGAHGSYREADGPIPLVVDGEEIETEQIREIQVRRTEGRHQSSTQSHTIVHYYLFLVFDHRAFQVEKSFSRDDTLALARALARALHRDDQEIEVRHMGQMTRNLLPLVGVIVAAPFPMIVLPIVILAMFGTIFAILLGVAVFLALLDQGIVWMLRRSSLHALDHYYREELGLED